MSFVSQVNNNRRTYSNKKIIRIMSQPYSSCNTTKMCACVAFVNDEHKLFMMMINTNNFATFVSSNYEHIFSNILDRHFLY